MYHTFYTISDLNYAIFNFVVVLFLLTIKEKKYNVYNLIFLFSILGIMALSYFISFGFIEEYWAYHRWFTVGVSLIGTAQLSNFLFHYPEKKWKYLPKIVLLYQAIAIITTSIFVYKSITATKIYQFDGHFWDVELPQLSQIVGVLILLLMLLAILTGIIKILLDKKEYRLQIFLMLFGFILIIFVPGLTNLFNRLYIISRELHHNVWVLVGISGTFLVLITYINYTREKTTLLTKIYAISIASILVIVQFSSYFILRDREFMYDQNQFYKSGRIIKDLYFRPDDLIAFGKIEKNFNILGLYQKLEKNISLDELIDEGEVALQIYKRNVREGLIDLKFIPMEYQKYVIGYYQWFMELFSKGKSSEEIFNEIKKNRNKILLLRKLINDLPENNFNIEFQKKIYEKRKDQDVYKYFLRNINLNNNKKEILKQIPIFYEDSERIYRYIDKPILNFWNKSFIGYFYHIDGEIYYLVYEYKTYREFINEVASVLLSIVLISIFAILVSYPIFFYLSVIKPLRRLVGGLEEVDKGNLGVYIDVYVEDEIGYVTRIFNKMVDSIRAKNRELEEYANKLELKVQERTQDLEKSLREIELLKEKQDGDYFLTSLLLKPLNINEVKDDDIVKVEIILEQYKKFQFRRWFSEIGGDFCGVYKIELRGKEYIFCVNSDAMGKSIQGAGGALVLGSVLEAIVERTRYEEMVKELYPEHWLKNTFVELHRVFESFNGSMLVSCILLLIDKKNGCGYFLNAEHPNLVLYRKGESKFIEPRKIFMKLGVSVDGLLEIEIIKLRSGDKLIMGSDGKDDLVLSVEGGVTKVNDDEKLFLEIVKESSGNLALIYGNLQERGEFRDDVSLISIEYKGDRDWKERNMYLSKEDKEKFDKSVELYNRNQFKEAENILEQLVERYKENGIIRKRLGYVKLKLGKYFEGLKELEKSFDLLPYDTHILKVLTKGYFKLKEYEKSIEYGELYILRESKDIEMFKHLIEVYEKLKDSPKERIRELAKKRMVKYKNYLNFYFNPNP